MRLKSIVRWVLSGGFLLAGLVLLGIFAINFFGVGVGSTATNGNNPSGFNVPAIQQTTAQQGSQQATGPKDKTLNVTIPAMSRIKDDKVPDATGGDEQALKKSAAIHLKGTGFPWQKGSNTYLAGHRMGYPGTQSFLTFYDLNKVGKGDKVYVKDSKGTKYTYKVYKTFTTGPSDLSVTQPVKSKTVLTLQTCTLPNYHDRLIVRAELMKKS